MGAISDALNELRKRTHLVSSTKTKLLRPAVGDPSAAGSRVIPAKSHDQMIGVRIDRGEQVGSRIKIYLQPNKNASNPTIKALAAKNSHQNLAEAWVDTTKPVDDKSVDEIFDALEEDAKTNGY